MGNISNTAASFRDPSGFVFFHEGRPLRCVRKPYMETYARFMGSGLYERLAREGLLIPHEEIGETLPGMPDDTVKIIRPEVIPFISYPFEWCFSALKDAALATLR